VAFFVFWVAGIEGSAYGFARFDERSLVIMK
jgi:hypothetical protein